MFTNKARTVSEYLQQLTPEQRTSIAAVRKVVRDNLPRGYEEAIGWGAITYGIPLKDYPNTYNRQPLCIAALSAGTRKCSLHLMAVYGDAATRKWLEDQFRKAGKKLDIGKACIRFTTPDDLPLDAIATVIAKVTPEKYIERYEAARKSSTRRAIRDSAIGDSKIRDSKIRDSKIRDSKIRDSKIRDSKIRDSKIRDSEIRD
jgi:hypothetical protein